VTILLEKAILH